MPYASGSLTEGKAPQGKSCDATTIKWPSEVTSRAFYETSSGRLKNLVHKGVMVAGISMNEELRNDYKGGVYKCSDHGRHYNNSNDNSHAH